MNPTLEAYTISYQNSKSGRWSEFRDKLPLQISFTCTEPWAIASPFEIYLDLHKALYCLYSLGILEVQVVPRWYSIRNINPFWESQ